MSRDNIIHNLYDWSEISVASDLPRDADFSTLEHSLGIHYYNRKPWTSGYVGVGRLVDRHGRILQTHGKEHIVVISPSKQVVDPWVMLEKVMADEEYPRYLEELTADGRFLFKVFYNQPLIKLSQDVRCSGDILYAISFIASCFSLCKKGLRKEMVYQEDNYTSKIKGKISVQKNIRANTSRGRNDRFYCKYIDFTNDNIENRILKSTLARCKKIIEKKFVLNAEIEKQYKYCMSVFKSVKTSSIKISDFNKATASGFYMYYRPVLAQARAIYSQKYYLYKSDSGVSISKSVYTIPYIINMETLFEFYVRAVLRDILPKVGCELVNYSERIFLDKSVSDLSQVKRGIHLMPYCIPDVLIKDSRTKELKVVLDVKYKNHERASRNDSLQLLSYVLLTGANICGFVFPSDVTEIKKVGSGTNDFITLNTPLLPMVKYKEVLLGDSISDSDILQILS